MKKTDLGTQIYQQWQEVCAENHAISQEYINMSFWQSLNLSYLKDLNTRREVAHQKWVLLWELLVDNDLITVKNGKTLTPSDLPDLPLEG